MKTPKSPLRWSSLSPRAAGFYWYRASDQHEASIVKVYWDGGEWSLQYRDLDMDPEHEDANVDWVRGWVREGCAWCQIPEPRDE